MKKKILCVAGLFFLVVGQIILSKGQEFVFRQKPIDYAHWFLLVGAILMFTFSSVLPKNTFHFIGTIITIMGITAFIGMCSIDFILWSFKTESSRSEFLNQLFNTPSISLPFIIVGPSFLYLGLTIQSLNYFRTNLPGFILTVSGTIIIGIGQLITHQRIIVVFGHVIFSIGLILILFLKQKTYSTNKAS
jgi:hypothetical protein